ncbi:unnamed protein product [Owenia fusiformis]|uniref:Uncharacterized protein n=1 Tax=Owenia fusiformis TaxID=6347 RepID=A0A8J1XI44_OWEFU|nr:unnamed protein product [Owenia fusiformis]
MGSGCSSRNAVNVQDGPNGTNIEERTHKFKICVLGDAKVGKTSVFRRYYRNQFDFSYQPTERVAIENVVKKLNIPENAVVSVTMWDLPGEEDIDLRKTYYRDMDAAIVVVDMTRSDNINNAGKWRREILDHAMVTKQKATAAEQGEYDEEEEVYIDHDAPETIPVLLLGNKYDIIEEKLKIEQSRRKDENEAQEERDRLIDDIQTRVEEMMKSGAINDTETIVIPETKQTDDNVINDDNRVNDDILNDDKNDNGNKNINDDKLVNEKPVNDDKTVSDDKPVNDENIVKDEKNPVNDDSQNNEEESKALVKSGEKLEKETIPTTTTTPSMETDDEVSIFADLYEEGATIPVCVKQLQKVQRESGCVGSVMVSAKVADGSVHAAIQALVRHLLELKMNKNKKSKKLKKKKKKQKNVKKRVDFEDLEECGVQEIDDLFENCNASVRKTLNYNKFYLATLKVFKQHCADAHIVFDPKCSLEDCIIALKEAAGKAGDEDSFYCEDDGQFVRLVIAEMKLAVPVERAVNSFHNEFGALCKAIMRDCPTICHNLESVDQRVESRCNDFIKNPEKIPPETDADIVNEDDVNSENKMPSQDPNQPSQRNMKNFIAAVERNRARIKNALIQTEENSQNVKNACQKVKAALLW